MPGRALNDLKVVEFAQMVSGPMCGKMFADMGAEVIKIEPPATGDEARRRRPFADDAPIPKKAASSSISTPQKKVLRLIPRPAAVLTSSKNSSPPPTF